MVTQSVTIVTTLRVAAASRLPYILRCPYVRKAIIITETRGELNRLALSLYSHLISSRSGTVRNLYSIKEEEED